MMNKFSYVNRMLRQVFVFSFISTIIKIRLLCSRGRKNLFKSAFLKNFDSGMYLVSTNGKYNHPDIETISKIINREIDISSNNENRRNIIINNETESVKKFDNKTLKDEFNYTIQYLNNKSIIIK